jgi:hypothetical protein
MKRIGELTMEKCCGRGWGMFALWPGGGRGNGRRDLAWRFAFQVDVRLATGSYHDAGFTGPSAARRKISDDQQCRNL